MKKTIILTLALTFAVASSQAFAASGKCSITAIEDGSITLNCGDKTQSFQVGDEVKIRSAKKKKAIEGC